jgi:hypothetical protein
LVPTTDVNTTIVVLTDELNPVIAVEIDEDNGEIDEDKF